MNFKSTFCVIQAKLAWMICCVCLRNALKVVFRRHLSIRIKNATCAGKLEKSSKCLIKTMFSELIVGESSDLKAQQELLFLGCGHILHRNCIEGESTKVTDFTCPSCFLQCHLNESPSGSKPSSPQKLPTSISQANFWLN